MEFMLNKMARAAQMEAREHHKKRFGYETHAWEDMVPEERERMRTCMRAALKAMRPSASSMELVRAVAMAEQVDPAALDQVLCAYIDAILAEAKVDA